MKSLLSKLEQAPEGSRELDAEIYFSIDTEKSPEALISQPAYEVFLRSRGRGSDLPHYTTSIDAALTLVPEYHYVGVACLWPGKPNCRIEVYTVIEQEDVEVGRNENLTTPPLALCIAALKPQIDAALEGGYHV